MLLYNVHIVHCYIAQHCLSMHGGYWCKKSDLVIVVLIHRPAQKTSHHSFLVFPVDYCGSSGNCAVTGPKAPGNGNTKVLNYYKQSMLPQCHNIAIQCHSLIEIPTESITALWVRLNVKWEIGKCLPRPSF